MYWFSLQQTVLGVDCTLSCHPEDDHYDVHHHSAATDGDLPNQGHLQEVQGKLGNHMFRPAKSPKISANKYFWYYEFPQKGTKLNIQLQCIFFKVKQNINFCWEFFWKCLHNQKVFKNQLILCKSIERFPVFCCYLHCNISLI